MKHKKKAMISIKQATIALSGFLLIAIIWQIVGTIGYSPAIPPLTKVIASLFNLIFTDGIWSHIFSSMEIILFGILIAVAFGFSLGILVFRYKFLRTAIMPIVESVRGIAALTLFPLIIVLFGLNNISRIFVIFWTAWPAVIISTINSLNIDSNIADAARLSGASEWRVLFQINLPIALDGIMTGIRISAGAGWISLIAAEMLGASKGLGFFLLWSTQSFEFDKVYATILIIAMLGGAMNYLLLLLQKKVYKITGGK